MPTPLPEARPLNPLQRRYFAWARPYYERMPPRMRVQAEAIDYLLYSRRGIGIWVGLVGALAGSILGLHGSGASWLAATVLSLVMVLGMVLCFISGWLLPERYPPRKLWTIAGLMVIVTFASSVGNLGLRGGLDGQPPGAWLDAVLAALWRATPFQLIAGLAMVLMVWVTSSARRALLQRELAQSRVEQERDAAARQASEARLRLLQAQIQPHFLFNTLAALQHWVDVGDARAAPLLRSLTGFLRGSTEMMLQPQVTLAQECEMAGHYLAIMQSRLGERLRYAIDMAPDCAGQPVPPGLLMTLVENAIEHGIEPTLRGGELRVVARRVGGVFTLHVLDDGAGMRADATDGVGLTNSRERLQHQFGDRAELTLATGAGGRGTTVLLRIRPDAAGPLLRTDADVLQPPLQAPRMPRA